MISLPGGRSSAKYMLVSALVPLMCALDERATWCRSFHSFSNSGSSW